MEQNDFNEIVGSEIEERRNLCEPVVLCAEKGITSHIEVLKFLNNDCPIEEMFSDIPFKKFIDDDKLIVICPICEKRLTFDIQKEMKNG